MTMRELVPWNWGRRDAQLSPSEAGDPFMALRRQVDDLFNGFASSFGWPSLGEPAGAGLMPSVDMVDEGDRLVLTAELPGMAEKDIELTLRGQSLVLQGEKKEQRELKEKDAYRLERSYGRVYRAIPLPCAVKEGGVKASFKHGVLTVELPKQESEAEKGRKIPVSGS